MYIAECLAKASGPQKPQSESSTTLRIYVAVYIHTLHIWTALLSAGLAAGHRDARSHAEERIDLSILARGSVGDR